MCIEPEHFGMLAREEFTSEHFKSSRCSGNFPVELMCCPFFQTSGSQTFLTLIYWPLAVVPHYVTLFFGGGGGGGVSLASAVLPFFSLKIIVMEGARCFYLLHLPVVLTL